MPSASVIAPILTFSQSSSVRGSTWMVPFFEMSHVTASKMLSASGSIVYRINSFTDTTGFIGPISGSPVMVFWTLLAGAACAGAGGAGFDEHDTAANAATTIAVLSMYRQSYGRQRSLTPPFFSRYTSWHAWHASDTVPETSTIASLFFFFAASYAASPALRNSAVNFTQSARATGAG